MKMRYINKKTMLAASVIILSCPQVFAEPPAEPVERLELQNIMREMGKNMQVITDGISREDWKLVEKTAPLIADHPQPSLIEKVKIFAYLGTNISTFKSYDNKTHNAAKVLGENAAAGDGAAIISDFATLQRACLSCHKHFREAFQQHFYGKK